VNRSGPIAAGSLWMHDCGMQSNALRTAGRVPAIVQIVLRQAVRRRAENGISGAVFEEQIRRLGREELEPKGLKLLVRELSEGRTRYIIKDQATGTVCDLLNFNAEGALEGDSVEQEVLPSV